MSQAEEEPRGRETFATGLKVSALQKRGKPAASNGDFRNIWFQLGCGSLLSTLVSVTWEADVSLSLSLRAQQYEADMAIHEQQ